MNGHSVARPRSGLALLVVVSGFLTGAGAQGTFALLTASASDASGFTTAASFDDTAAPTVGGSVVAKTGTGSIVGYIHQGGGYRVYANVTDPGNPSSGVTTVTADVSAITSGSTAIVLTAGSYSTGGVSYGYRSAALDANPSLAEGIYGYSITATDANGNAGTQGGFTVTVDNTAPSGVDVDTVNVGLLNLLGTPEANDRIVFTYSERIDPETVRTSWTGSSVAVTVRIANNGAADIVTIWNAANTVQLGLGAVDTKADIVSAATVFGASGTPSTMVQNGASITITLGTRNSGAVLTSLSLTPMVWTPSSQATDGAGNPSATTPTTESGLGDPPF
ncbi:MAG: hypothetical protein M3452_03965 [Chloroflexota bacterium]|nr:hypothetical protein [Chloroflexota bacterium]